MQKLQKIIQVMRKKIRLSKWFAEYHYFYPPKAPFYLALWFLTRMF